MKIMNDFKKEKKEIDDSNDVLEFGKFINISKSCIITLFFVSFILSLASLIL